MGSAVTVEVNGVVVPVLAVSVTGVTVQALWPDRNAVGAAGSERGQDRGWRSGITVHS
jgi:hypothetical protein